MVGRSYELFLATIRLVYRLHVYNLGGGLLFHRGEIRSLGGFDLLAIGPDYFWPNDHTAAISCNVELNTITIQVYIFSHFYSI